jgi:acyl-coenzyme A thioesterase PaaI-like protein
MSSQEMHPMVRTVASTQSEMTEIVLPNDTNMLGNLLGGRLMHLIDLTGAMAAYRHARTHVVTASMDHIDFIQPVRLGDLKPETPDEVRRCEDALRRRQHREGEKTRRTEAKLVTASLKNAGAIEP